MVGGVSAPPEPRWKCTECDRVRDDSELLRAPSPFDPTDTVIGCSGCKGVNTVALVCEVKGCSEIADCGFQAGSRYWRTCGHHYQQVDQA